MITDYQRYVSNQTIENSAIINNEGIGNYDETLPEQRIKISYFEYTADIIYNGLSVTSNTEVTSIRKLTSQV